MIFLLQNLLEHDISNKGNNTLLSQLSKTYFFIIGQDWYILLNHCLISQRQPHARPCAMPHALLSNKNDVIDVIYLVHLVNWVLVILDNSTLKSLENIHRNEKFHQNPIGFTKFIANVREKLRVDKKNF